MNYFEHFLEKRNLTKEKIDSMLSYKKMSIKGTDNVCRFLHDIPKDTSIGIISDYDTDGLLSEVVKFLGLHLIGFTNISIARRSVEHGYELKRSDIDKLGDVSLIITSDVGIACYDAIDYAKSKGISVIVTDHHVPEAIEENHANFIIDYLLDDDFCNANTDVCGAYTVYQIFERYAEIFPNDISDYESFMNDLKLIRHFAAVATVSDAMPILGINHHIVGEMLHFFNYINPIDKSDDIVQGTCNNGVLQNVYNNFHTFINSLIESSYIRFDMNFLNYTVIPAINSIKRMSADPMLFYVMLFGPAEKSKIYADYIVNLSKQRKDLVKKSYEEMIVDNDHVQPFGSIVFTSSAPSGLLGLLAQDALTATGLPAVVLHDTPEYDEELGEMVYKGSARSPKTYAFLSNVNKSGLAVCRGHEPSCGITVKVDNLSALYDFLKKEVQRIADTVRTYDIFMNKEEYLNHFDVHLDYDSNVFNFLQDIEQFMLDLEQYAPFGQDFEAPNIILSFNKQHGLFSELKKGKHTKISLAPSFQVLSWNTAKESVLDSTYNDTVYLTGQLSKSLFRGEWSMNFVAAPAI